MQFTIVTVLALAAVALGSPVTSRDVRIARLARRQGVQPIGNPSAIQSGPAVSDAAMTTADGSVVDFNAEGVYLAAVEAGL